MKQVCNKEKNAKGNPKHTSTWHMRIMMKT